VNSAFVLTAGGTGGHRFPAEAVAGELVAHGRVVHLLSDARTEGFAGRLTGIEVHRVHVGRLGGGPIRNAYAYAELIAGAVQAGRLLRRLAPAGVIGFGGYSSVPTMLAASYLGFPTVIHEQNAVLGRANRWLAARMRHIATGFQATRGLRPAERSRAIYTGNPVRQTILAVGERGYLPPRPGGPIELLVLGGSQGAHVFSEIVPPALAALPAPLRGALRVSQQARAEDLAATVHHYAELGIPAEIESFFADVPKRLARAHLVLCRAGASTIAELAAAGRPALLVPYPYATDDHQTANAQAFAEAGGGWSVAQSELGPDQLARRLEQLLADPARLAAAARAAFLFGGRDAARQLALLALALTPEGIVEERAA
jgi:UDP-N-acetylglucosamine--N-acetylmuramyl-(pentapeptide) pyrophosphoryl-undecaprenol N-acetylglucosamine transferase